MNEHNNNTMQLPVVALRGLVVFPGSAVSFDVGRQKSIEALEYAAAQDTPVFLVAQRSTLMEEPEPEDLYGFGTVSKVRQVIRLQGHQETRVVVEGVERARIVSMPQKEPFFMAELASASTLSMSDILEAEGISEPKKITALIRTAQDGFEEFSLLWARLSPDITLEALECKKAGDMADLIGLHIPMALDNKQLILEELDEYRRLTMAVKFLFKEISVLKLQREIFAKVKTNIDQTQKEYFLREQVKVIQKELGDKEGVTGDLADYRERISKGRYPDVALEKLEKELKRLERMNASGPESSITRDYIEWVLDLPWHKKTRENRDLAKAQTVLDKDHYGLEKVKERVVEFLAVRQTASPLDAPIICLVGPPGVGKTSIAKSIARALQRKYVRMSLGGVRDEAEIRGHRRTYIGSIPGRIMYAMKQAGSVNPLILLDEVDKMSRDLRGDPASALLEVLDGEQNKAFRDHYLELPYDLSDVLFICTANTADSIPDALRDRLEIITLSSYTYDEKINIASRFLVDKQIRKHGLKKNQLRIKQDALSDVLHYYTKESGVRQLERCVGQLCRKAVKELLTAENKKTVTIDSDNLENYLGKRKFHLHPANELPEIGIARGLAWTKVGGDTLSIEVNTVKGSGKFELTGNMGTVMKESARAAMSYVRSEHVVDVHMPKKFYKNRDIHIHIPEGAVPKDGPSAGITMATAMVSALSGIPVRNDVGMTGEITIRGRVLPIGGIKEKVLAAKSAGLKKVILPLENEGDLKELPENVTTGIEFVLAKHMDEVLSHALQTSGELPWT